MTARGELECWGEPGAGNPEALERLQAATQRAATQGSGKKCNRFSKELNQRKEGRTQRQSAGTRSRGSVPTPRGVYRIREPREESKRRREGQAEWKVSVRRLASTVLVCLSFLLSKDRKKRKAYRQRTERERKRKSPKIGEEQHRSGVMDHKSNFREYRT
jgi:hypothetical protein